jgi:hypothetical protein
MTDAAVSRPVELPSAALLELARALRTPDAPVVRARWVGATSTVLRIDDLCVKVPHDSPGAVSSCLTHAAVAPAARRLGVRGPEVPAVHHLADVPVPLVVSRFPPGEPLPRAEHQTAVWREVGRDLARLHGTTREQVDVELRTFTQHDEVDPRRLVEAVRDAGRLDDALAGTVFRLRDGLVDHVLPDERPVLCHGDVHTENVLVDRGRYTGLSRPTYLGAASGHSSATQRGTSSARPPPGSRRASRRPTTACRRPRPASPAGRCRGSRGARSPLGRTGRS